MKTTRQYKNVLWACGMALATMVWCYSTPASAIAMNTGNKSFNSVAQTQSKSQQATQYRAYARLLQPWFKLARTARHTLNTFDPTDPSALQHWGAFYQEWEATSGQITPYLQTFNTLPIRQYRSYQTLQTLQQQLATYRSVLQQGHLGLPGNASSQRLEAAENARLALEQWLALEPLYSPLW